MLLRFTSWLGPLPRFLLGLAGFLAALAVTGALWWWLPVRPFATLPAQPDDCRRLRISQDGRFLLAVHDKHLAIWDLERRREVGRCPYRWVANVPSLEAFWFSPDGLAVGFADGTVDPPQVWLWNRELQTAPIRLPDCWSIPDQLLRSATLVTYGKGGYRLWHATGKELPLPGGQGEIRTIQHLAARGLLVGTEEYRDDGWLVNPSRLIVWKNLTGQVRRVIIPGAKLPAECSPDGRLLAATHVSQTCLHDLETGQLLAVLPPPAERRTDSPQYFSPDSRLLVTTPDQLSEDRLRLLAVGLPTIWDVSVMPPRKLVTLEVPEVVAPPMVSPDGLWAAVWERLDRNGAVPRVARLGYWGCRILDTRTWQPEGMIPRELDQAPVFAPDSRTIAGAVLFYEEPTLLDQWLRPTRGRVPFRAVKLWEIPTGQEVAVLRGGVCFAYPPDGRYIAVGTENGSIQLWDIPPRRPWWTDSGLPVGFAVLALLAVRFVWRAMRKGERPNPVAEVSAP
jgi:WD40 repeat protein